MSCPELEPLLQDLLDRLADYAADPEGYAERHGWNKPVQDDTEEVEEG